MNQVGNTLTILTRVTREIAVRKLHETLCPPRISFPNITLQFSPITSKIVSQELANNWHHILTFPNYAILWWSFFELCAAIAICLGIVSPWPRRCTTSSVNAPKAYSKVGLNLDTGKQPMCQDPPAPPNRIIVFLHNLHNQKCIFYTKWDALWVKHGWSTLALSVLWFVIFSFITWSSLAGWNVIKKFVVKLFKQRNCPLTSVDTLVCCLTLKLVNFQEFV